MKLEEAEELFKKEMPDCSYYRTKGKHMNKRIGEMAWLGFKTALKVTNQLEGEEIDEVE